MANVGNYHNSLVLIQSQTVTSSVASVTFSTGINSIYNTYLFILSNLTASTSGIFRCRVGNGGGLAITGYLGGRTQINMSSASSWATSTTNTAFAPINSSVNTSNPNGSGTLLIMNATNGSYPCLFADAFINTAGVTGYSICGTTCSTTNLTQVQFFLNAANINTAVITLYGVNE